MHIQRSIGRKRQTQSRKRWAELARQSPMRGESGRESERGREIGRERERGEGRRREKQKRYRDTYRWLFRTSRSLHQKDCGVASREGGRRRIVVNQYAVWAMAIGPVLVETDSTRFRVDCNRQWRTRKPTQARVILCRMLSLSLSLCPRLCLCLLAGSRCLTLSPKAKLL